MGSHTAWVKYHFRKEVGCPMSTYEEYMIIINATMLIIAIPKYLEDKGTKK